MLFTCKKNIFSVLRGKKCLLKKMVGEGGAGAPPAPPAFFLRPWTFILYLTAVFSFLSKSYCIVGTLVIPFRFYSVS